MVTVSTNMATISFHSQLVSIMDALSKTVVLEISKLVEIESKMLKIEINRGRNEIASLTEKLQLMENLLWIAQGHRQDTAECTITYGSGNNWGGLEPGVTRLPIKSESSRENKCSTNEASREDEERSHQRFIDESKEQPELIVIKDEPVEDENCDKTRTQQEIVTETREEMGQTDTQKESSDVQMHPTSDYGRQPIISSFVTTNNLYKALWDPNSPHRPEHPKTEAGKSIGRNSASKILAKNMRIHSLRNESTKRFGCVQCGKSFRCFSQLEIHQRSHTGEKPFRCTLCGKRYAQKGHLYTHQRTHTGEKPYRCSICSKGFIQKCTLDMHQRTHTGEKPFVCIQCGKGFTKNCNLKKHLAVHTDSNM